MGQGSDESRQAGASVRFQFGVRGLLLVVALLMIPCAIVGNRVRFFQNQDAILERFREDESVRVGVLPVQTDWLTAWLLNGKTQQVDEVYVIHGNADQSIQTLVHAGATELEHVYLDFRDEPGPGISEVGIQVLGWLPRLRTFTSFDAEVSFSALQALNRLPHLEDLTLWGDWVQDEHLKAIPTLPALTVLSVDSTRITGASISVLGRHPKLAILEIPETLVDDGTNMDMQTFRTAMPHLLIRPVGQGVVIPGSTLEVQP